VVQCHSRAVTAQPFSRWRRHRRRRFEGQALAERVSSWSVSAAV